MTAARIVLTRHSGPTSGRVEAELLSVIGGHRPYSIHGRGVVREATTEASAPYREYLWVGSEKHKQSVRWAIELALRQVKKSLLYLAEDYWGHYTGWPDLMIRKGDMIQLVEVKPPNDRPSEDQIRWFNDNHQRLGFDALLLRVKRRRE